MQGQRGFPGRTGKKGSKGRKVGKLYYVHTIVGVNVEFKLVQQQTFVCEKGWCWSRRTSWKNGMDRSICE